jgi:hypothetical protein
MHWAQRKNFKANQDFMTTQLRQNLEMEWLRQLARLVGREPAIEH